MRRDCDDCCASDTLWMSDACDGSDPYMPDMLPSSDCGGGGRAAREIPQASLQDNRSSREGKTKDRSPEKSNISELCSPSAPPTAGSCRTGPPP